MKDINTLRLYYVHAYDRGNDFDLSRWVTASSHAEAEDLWRNRCDAIVEDEHDPDDFDVWVEETPSLLSSQGVHN